jgi:hypothetical protein
MQMEILEATVVTLLTVGLATIWASVVVHWLKTTPRER